MSARWLQEDDQDDLFLEQRIKNMEEKTNLCKFIRDLNLTCLTYECSESNYAVKIQMCDSCKLPEKTNDAARLTQASNPYGLEQSLRLIEKIKNHSKLKGSMRKRNKRLTIEKKSAYQPLNGEGITRLANGDVVFGKWENGTVEGRAKVLYNSGNTYVGDVKDCRSWGSGTYVFKRNSYKYEGEFADGMFEGRGVLTDDQGSIIKKGIWRKGSLIQPLN